MKKVCLLLALSITIIFFAYTQDQQAPAAGDAAQTDQSVDQGAQAVDQGADQGAGTQPQSAALARQKISELIGYNIVGSDGSQIGEVRDFVITSDGRIPYATATFDDIDIDGDVVIPVEAITFGNAPDDTQAATLSFDVAQLQGAQNIPVITDQNSLAAGWEQTASSFWQERMSGAAMGAGEEAAPAAEAMPESGSQAYLASTLLGYEVEGSDEQNLGGVKDILVDLENNQVVYVALGVGGFLGIGENLFAIPMEEFQINTDEEYLTLNVSQDFFDNAQGFDSDNWPSEVSQNWRQDIENQTQTLGSGEQSGTETGDTGAADTMGTDDATGTADDTGAADTTTSDTGTDTELQTQDEASGASGQTDQQQ